MSGDTAPHILNSGGEDVLRILCIPNVHYHVHNSATSWPVSQPVSKYKQKEAIPLNHILRTFIQSLMVVP